MRILIVEDEKRLAGTLAELLHRRGYTVDVSYDGVSGLDNARSGIYDLVLLDAMLPGLDGFTLLQQLRAGGDTVPVRMLAARSDLSDRVRGLDCGADYYLTKPFDPEELLARVGAMTRRKGAMVLNEISYEDLTLDFNTVTLHCGSQDVQLSPKEFQIARLMLTEPNMTFSKELLITRAWGMDSGATDNMLEAYISFLRKKLRYLGSRVTIRNLQRIGYRLEVQP